MTQTQTMQAWLTGCMALRSPIADTKLVQRVLRQHGGKLRYDDELRQHVYAFPSLTALNAARVAIAGPEYALPADLASGDEFLAFLLRGYLMTYVGDVPHGGQYRSAWHIISGEEAAC